MFVMGFSDLQNKEIKEEEEEKKEEKDGEKEGEDQEDSNEDNRNERLKKGKEDQLYQRKRKKIL